MAKTALLYGTGLVVSNGLSSRPSGPLYPELLELLDDQPVIERPTAFNAFLDEQFTEAVHATGRRKLAIGGISTEGCVLQTVLGALRAGYEPYVVVDATASLSREAHETALQRACCTRAQSRSHGSRSPPSFSSTPGSRHPRIA